MNSAWERQGDQIVREWTFEDFASAMEFVNRVAGAAESADHHPDIFVHGSKRVRLSLTTHSAGRLTDKDFNLARVIDGVQRPHRGRKPPESKGRASV